MNLTGKQQRSLEMFMNKRKKWIEHYSGSDRNSIANQLYNLIWYTAVFRVINHSRPYSTESDGSFSNNGMIHNFMDNCFFEYQFMAIRRLLDRDIKKSYSLYALVCDMERNHRIITRFNYFQACGFEYDVEKIKKQREEYAREQQMKGRKSYTVPRDLIWETCEEYHKTFDFLSNTMADTRSPTDFVQKDFFTTLKTNLEQLNEIVGYADKFIAHLERPSSGRSNIDEIEISLDKIWNAHKIICNVATLIAKTFLDGGGGFLGVTQFDQFENIEKPFVEEKFIPELKQVWHKYFKETESWAYINVDNYDEFLGDEVDIVAGLED